MHNTIPEAIARQRMLIGIAISDLNYGLKGYIGYDIINDTLIKNGITNRTEAFYNKDVLNKAINKTLDLDVSSNSKYPIYREDKGMVVYYKMAFLLFGYNVQGFLYLYYLLFLVSVLIFIFTFYNRIDLLNILLLFVLSHYFLVSIIPYAGIELQTVHNQRFLAVLGLLPSIYLSFIIFWKYRLSAFVKLGTLIQILILIFVYFCRSSIIYQILFLLILFVIGVLRHWFKNPELGKLIFIKINIFPIFMICITLFLLQLHLILSLHHSYDSTTSKHLFWHDVYKGLSVHPKSKIKHNIYGYKDDSVQQFVDDYAKKHLDRESVNSEDESKLYEAIVKNKVVEIIKNDPFYIFSTFFYYKINSFFHYFTTTLFKTINNYSFWIILLLITSTSTLINKVFMNKWFDYFKVVTFAMPFSLLPALIAFPHPSVYSDTILMFTFYVYLILSGIICYLSNKYSILKVLSKSYKNN